MTDDTENEIGGVNDDLTEEMQAGITNADQKSTAANTEKYLTFTLKDEDYGIGILKVREIIGFLEVTPVPQTPDFVRGVVNLRGQVVPVLDLRLRFGMEQAEITDETCIIVVEVEFALDDGDTQQVQMGILVDTVQEVLDIPVENIEPAPSFGGDIDTEYIEGMGKIEEDVVILLDIDRVLTDEELVALDEISDE